ncbi:hypothetical protein OCH7691_00315 [Oceanibacterium hippocampi]|uniref:RcnB family protein n=1 Tax=Oceanibacterium hippocampi TaxID=745714 RepID=A0A1Y5RG21_9PROT|nr:hypothetical protein OCH7691_00315 [Oceanibacterium hippocampi]
MKSASMFISAVLILALSGAMPALAKNDKGDKGKGPAVKSEKTIDDAIDRIEREVIDEVLDGVFGENDRTIIETWYRQHPAPVSSLPPGIAKRLARGKPLPPGIAKRGLPDGLAAQLAPLGSRYERVIVGDDVTIIETATAVVVDILRDVLRRH